MRRRFTPVVATFARVAAWIRKDYPKEAPERGHCYLLALLGGDYTSH